LRDLQVRTNRFFELLISGGIALAQPYHASWQDDNKSRGMRLFATVATLAAICLRKSPTTAMFVRPLPTGEIAHMLQPAAVIFYRLDIDLALAGATNERYFGPEQKSSC
jgi:hypothetical protein